MKILILGRYDDRDGFETPELFAKHLPQRLKGHEVVFSHFDDLQFFAKTGEAQIIEPGSGYDLKDFDRVFLFGWFKSWRDVTLGVAYYLKNHGVQFWNSEAYHQNSRGKVSQAVIFALNNISIPPTAFCASPTPEFLEKALTWVGNYPLIAKAAGGYKGKNNHLVKDQAQLEELIKNTDPQHALIFQQFMPNDGDLRVVITNSKVQLLLHRKAIDPGTHLHNISQGAQGNFLPLDTLPAQVQDQCVKVAELMHRELSGLDVVQNKETGEWFVLESNNMPQLVSWRFADEHADVLTQMLIG